MRDAANVLEGLLERHDRPIARDAPRPQIQTMSDRRYSDAEVTEILRRATVPRPDGPGALVQQEGMTLGQLEAIAREAGIEPEHVAAAARELDIPHEAPKRAVGVPVSVSRSVELPRKLSDAEWEFLVTRLRETFDAPGKLETHGTLRQWGNGNLRVMLEPGLNGHRVRFTSLNESVRIRIVTGALAAGFGAVVTLAATLAGGEAVAAAFGTSGILGIIGAVMAGDAVRRSKEWRAERRAQFEALALELERLTRER